MAKNKNDQSKAGGTFNALAPRRNSTRMAVGALVIVLTALGSVLLFQQVGDRREVLVMSSDVDAGTAIKRTDVATARISLDPGINYFDAKQLEEIVGRVPSADLVQGSILNPRQLAKVGSPQVGVDEALVGLVIPLGQRPVLSNIAVGQVVFVRPTSEATSSASPDGSTTPEVEARIFSIINDKNSGALVDVVVRRDQAPLIASWGPGGAIAFRPGNQESTLGVVPPADDTTEGDTE